MSDPKQSFLKKPLTRLLLIALALHVILAIISMFIFLPQFVEIKEKFKIHFNLKATREAATESAAKGFLDAPKTLDPRSSQVENRTAAASAVRDVTDSEKLGAKFANAQDVSRVNQLMRSDNDFFTPQKIMINAQENALRDNVIQKPAIKSQSLADQYRSKSIEEKQVTDESALKTMSQATGRMQSRYSGNVDMDPEEGMPGFTPARGIGNEVMPQGEVGEKNRQVTSLEALDDFLDIEVSTYEDPGSHEKFYRIRIFAKPKAKLEVMRKEMIFLVDSSLSISPDRLDEFKKGLRLALEALNPGDLFNVVAFKETTTFFESQSVVANAQNIDRAVAFLADLHSNRKTDVFNAVETLVNAKASLLPSNIVLISDGRPSQGVLNAREMLSKISNVNHKTKPIFCFSGGAKVNRYLLDFIAYQNRGWAEYVKRYSDIDEGFDAFCLKIKDPILIDLQYEARGLDQSDIFPRWLPDFYRGAEFVIYGRYEDEDQFVMQLLGRIGGKRKELIFKRSLLEAKKGGPEIQRGYAFNRVYHLISELSKYKDNPKLKEELDELSSKYGIVTPYSEEVERID